MSRAPKDKQELNITSDAGKSRLPSIPDYIPAEVFLETIGYFTPSSTRIKNRVEKEKIIGEKIALDGTKKMISVAISANAKLGLPITSDLDYYRAFLKICDEIADKAGILAVPVRVPSKRLAEYAGKEWGGKTHQEIMEWFERMNWTGIRGGMYRAKTKNYEDSFSGVVFSQVVRRGERFQDGTIASTNYVWPAAWFIDNYNYRYIRPIDLNFHRRLTKPIAKALYSLLETGWYASSGNPYSKSYGDLCGEFLLTEYHQISRIKQQLNPAHEELQRERFLESWDYRETGGERGKFVVVYYAGAKYFQDQKARKERHALAKMLTEPKRQEGGEELASHGTPLAGIIHEITDVTKDTQSIPYYVKLVRELSETKVWELLSLTKQATLEGRVKTTPARYFTDLAQRALSERKATGGA